jgi:hypothetical protein
MATSGARRPLPALAFLLALSLLTALVWWRVLHRADATSQAATTPSPSCSPPAPVTAVPAPAGVTVQVLNSTQRTGLASSVGTLLVHDGFKLAGVANDLTSRAPVEGVAEIRFGPAGATAAALLAYYVPGATLVRDTRTSATIDLALGAKYAALAAPTAVAKALTAAHVTQLPPPPSHATTPTHPKTTAKSTATATHPSTTSSSSKSSSSKSSSSNSSSVSAPASC